MKIDKNELSQQINKLKQVVPKKTYVPALQGILVSDGYLTANNMELAIMAKIEGIDGESFIIPAKAFDLINNLPDGEVEIIPESKGESFFITIKADKIRNRYQTVDPDEFPVPDTVGDGGGEFSIKAGSLMDSIRHVSYAIPGNGEKQIMSALCLQASGGTLNFVGTNGHMLAWDKIDYEGEFELLIPKGTVDRMIAVGITGDVFIRHDSHVATFSTEKYEIHTRIVEGKYFKYDGLFNNSSIHTVAVRSELLDAVVRARMCTDWISPVIFRVKGSEMDISIKDTVTDYQETVGLQEEVPEELTIGFNAKLVAETLKAFDCCNIAINFENARRPMIFEAEDSDFKAIVLPVNMAK